MASELSSATVSNNFILIAAQGRGGEISYYNEGLQLGSAHVANPHTKSKGVKCLDRVSLSASSQDYFWKVQQSVEYRRVGAL